MESGHIASATAFRNESHLDTSPLFGILRPDLVDVRYEANPTGENMAIITENGNTSETALPGSTRRRTTSGKDLQEVRAAAKVAMENNLSMSPSKEREMARETSQDGQKGRTDGNTARRLLPRDELVAYLQRGLLWQEAVQHANDDVRLEGKFKSTIAHHLLIMLYRYWTIAPPNSDCSSRIHVPRQHPKNSCERYRAPHLASGRPRHQATIEAKSTKPYNCSRRMP